MTGVVGVLLLLVVLGAGGALAWPRVVAFRRARAAYRRLAQASGLTPEQSRWLWRLARRTSPDKPALIFVRPSLFEPGAAAGGSPIAAAVRQRLFD